MDRSIQLRSEEWGYRAALLALCIWTLCDMYQSLADHSELDMLPCLILCLVVCVQAFSQMAIRQKMVAGDEEYEEPNGLVHAVILAVIFVTVVLALGVHFLLRA